MKKYISRKYSIHYILFINGALILALEVLGIRILAPMVGTTVTVWSAMIGIILLASSVGYYAGGYIADQKISRNILATTSFEAGLFILLIVPLRGSVLTLTNSFSYEVSSLLSALYLFALPTVFLSMTTTYAIRLKLISINSVGKINGILYGVSTAGSLFGVFLISFILIPKLNVTTIIVFLALLSFLNSVIATKFITSS